VVSRYSVSDADIFSIPPNLFLIYLGFLPPKKTQTSAPIPRPIKIATMTDWPMISCLSDFPARESQYWQRLPASDNEEPRIVKAGTDKVGMNLSDDCDNTCENARVLWAPNSRRFAFNYGNAKESLTSIYELRGDEWIRLKTLGEDDEIAHRTDNIVRAQANRKGLPKKTFLHMRSWEVDANRWIDSSTLCFHCVPSAPTERDDVGLGFGGDLLFTLELDEPVS
jgi:hypothetical protein